jgi:ERCC4-type nuclease
MILTIDCREKELFTQICCLQSMSPQFKDIQIVLQNLPIGDIILSQNEEELLIVERKTVNDLLSSIKDGRYDEQSFRLDGNPLHNHNIVYLIEGEIKTNKNPNQKQTFFSALFSLNYYKGFSVIRTFSLEETALFLCNSMVKITKEQAKMRKPFYYKTPVLQGGESEGKEESESESKGKSESESKGKSESKSESKGKSESKEKDYISLVKKVKKENITKDNIDEMMLCQIPGISKVTAVALIQHFGSFKALLEANEDLLKTVCYTNEKKQVRRLTKTVIANIGTFLWKKI